MTTTSSAERFRFHTLKRVAPTCLAIVPIGLLFGVLAAQAKWSIAEVFIFSALGFSGSGQFALLPLADGAITLSTMIFLAIAINSRYIPIAFSTASRLPHKSVPRAIVAHLLGDEAYALEQPSDHPAVIATLRLYIFGAWVLSSVGGVLVASLLPDLSAFSNINVSIPASLVLLFLSVQQIHNRLFKENRSAALLREVFICILAALVFFWLLGKLWFWLPSISFMTWRFMRVGL